MSHLQDKFRRLSLNRLETVDKQIIDFMTQRRGLSVYTLNCQSLRAHSADLTDSVIRKSSIVLLSETWLNDNEDISIPSFNCVIKYKRLNVRAGGVAIYHTQDDSVNIVTPNMEMTARQSQSYSSTVTPVGDVCIAECQTLNGKTIVIAAIYEYISPNQNLDDIIYFIHRLLLVYSHAGANALGRGEDKIPLILGGDFNVNFGSNDSLPLIQFLRETFGLQINNNPKESTTKSGTTLDAIFTRYLENIESRTYISYFSYHKPIISVLPIEPPTDDSIMHI